MSGRRPGLKKSLAVVFGVLGAAGLSFLAIGVILPGKWEAERSIHIGATAAEVFVRVDSLVMWDEWTIWGDVPSTLEGPGRGTGAVRVWDDPAYGSGRFTIVESLPGRSLRYRVIVEGGAMTILGSFVFAPDDEGTNVTWREEGDFGRNPLLGYVARTMDESQGDELERSLQRLRSLLEGGS